MNLKIGQEIGNFRITGRLGVGGMGAVYCAENKLIGKRVAIKVLRPSASADARLVKRFFNEARAASSIEHPGIVEILDCGYYGEGIPYIVMEYVDGESLDARIRRLGRLPVELAISIARRIADALAAAHEENIVHRDLKPDNVMLLFDSGRGSEEAGEERVKLLDFGVAKLLMESGQSANSTRTGILLGTPLYMSPEQCIGAARIDGRADLYAMGCMLFAMLCGHPPFRGGGAGQILAAHIHVEPPRPSKTNRTVPPALDALIERLLRKNPGDRFACAREVDRALQAIGSDGTPRAVNFASSDQTTLPLGVDMLSSPSLSQWPTSKRDRAAVSADRPVPSPGRRQGVATVGPMASGSPGGDRPAGPAARRGTDGDGPAGLAHSLEDVSAEDSTVIDNGLPFGVMAEIRARSTPGRAGVADSDASSSAAESVVTPSQIIEGSVGSEAEKPPRPRAARMPSSPPVTMESASPGARSDRRGARMASSPSRRELARGSRATPPPPPPVVVQPSQPTPTGITNLPDRQSTITKASGLLLRHATVEQRRRYAVGGFFAAAFFTLTAAMIFLGDDQHAGIHQPLPPDAAPQDARGSGESLRGPDELSDGAETIQSDRTENDRPGHIETEHNGQTTVEQSGQGADGGPGSAGRSGASAIGDRDQGGRDDQKNSNGDKDGEGTMRGYRPAKNSDVKQPDKRLGPGASRSADKKPRRSRRRKTPAGGSYIDF
ncbi:MAG: protein kinase [Proteobacteria bacterium]|nr:protein kinase [Pseudomonadota bacterium]